MMDIKLDMTKVSPADTMKGEDDEETALLKKMLQEASDYICSFAWCAGIKESYLGIGIGGVIGVFLFKIRPSREEVDEWLWVIVGDLPSAYITIEESPNPACALDSYIGAMTKWVDAVKAGETVNELIPVNVPPTLEYAKMLESRLEFLDKEVLAYYSNDLKS